MSNLSSQAGPPTFKNLGFMMAGARFAKSQGLGFKDALDGVVELSWAHFGCSWSPSHAHPESKQGSGFVGLT